MNYSDDCDTSPRPGFGLLRVVAGRKKQPPACRMSRADLIAACKAAAPDTPEWKAAVCALGAFASRPVAPRPARATGLSPLQLIWRVTNSRVFAQDRETIRGEARYAGAARLSELFDYVTQEAASRKRTMRHLYTTNA